MHPSKQLSRIRATRPLPPPRRSPHLLPTPNPSPSPLNPKTPPTPSPSTPQNFPKPKSAVSSRSLPTSATTPTFPTWKISRPPTPPNPRHRQIPRRPRVGACLENQPAYTDCANNPPLSPNFFRNASVNLEKSHKGLAWLQNLPHPKELQPVIDYLFKNLSASVAVEDAKFRYLLHVGCHRPEKNHRGPWRIIRLLHNIPKTRRRNIERRKISTRLARLAQLRPRATHPSNEIYPAELVEFVSQILRHPRKIFRSRPTRLSHLTFSEHPLSHSTTRRVPQVRLPNLGLSFSDRDPNSTNQHHQPTTS